MRFNKIEKTEALENGWVWAGLGAGILVGIPILKNISKLKKELKDAEEALNHVKDY